MIKTMNTDPVVLAMANPTPEIMPDEAKAAGAKIVGRVALIFQIRLTMLLHFREFSAVYWMYVRETLMIQ